jgi:hypothetical protein
MQQYGGPPHMRYGCLIDRMPPLTSWPRRQMTRMRR